MNVISTYPLMNTVIVNNLYILITGHDTSTRSEYRFDAVLRVGLKLVMAILPILAAFGVANLIYILKYIGLLGLISNLFPLVLQLRSIHVCKKTFLTSPSSSISMSASNHTQFSDKKGGKGGVSWMGKKKKASSLLFLDSKKQDLYMTPYSILIFSHPVAVCVIGVIGICFFMFALSSLFVHPQTMTCSSFYDRVLN